MFIVATVDQNWAIGKNDSLLYRIPVDRAYFRELTAPHIIVYGKKSTPAFEDIGAEQKRIILTRDNTFTYNDATIIHSITELDRFDSDELYIVGGASVFQQLYRKCKYAFITRVETVTLDSDAFFPKIHELDNWAPIEQTPIMRYQGLPFRFVTYRNNDLD